MSSAVMPTYARAPLSFVKGEGSWLIEADGRRFLDLGGGIAVNVLGHANAELADVLATQSQSLWHTSNLYNIPNQERLGEMLVDATFADQVFFTNSGTEAMECVVKTARKYWHHKGEPGRTKIIAFEGSFHGRTIAMIAAAGAEKLVNGFGPLTPGFVQIPLGDPAALEAEMDETVAGILIEPVQGEGGIIPVPDAELRALRALCDETGVLLLMDEIQCGVGRTGKLFAHEWAGVTPDIMAVAKGIGGGFPLGACLATKEAASGMIAGTHGSTYGGNPLGTAVGAKVMELVNTPDFLQEVTAKSGHLDQKLAALIDAHPKVFSELRGLGLMKGIKCVVPNIDVVNAGYEAEVLTVPGGDNVIRLLPALNITTQEIDEAVARLDKAAQAIEAKL